MGGPVSAARSRSAAWHTSRAIFGGAYVGAIVFVASVLRAPRAALLVLAAGSRLGVHRRHRRRDRFLRGIWLDGSRRLAWPRTTRPRSRLRQEAAPSRLNEGIRFEGVVRLSRHRPPGLTASTHAARGLGGRDRRRERRGKTTLVKLWQAVSRPGRSSSTARRSRACARTTGAGVSRERSRISSASSSAPGTRWASAMSRAWMTRLPFPPPSRGPAPMTSSRGCPRGSRPSSDRRGPAGSRFLSASGRSSRWRAGSCAIGRSCSCSTSRRRRSTQRPSTRSSNDLRRRRAATLEKPTRRRARAASRSWCRTVLDRAHGRQDRRTGRLPRRPGRHA